MQLCASILLDRKNYHPWRHIAHTSLRQSRAAGHRGSRQPMVSGDPHIVLVACPLLEYSALGASAVRLCKILHGCTGVNIRTWDR
ncbi:30S ribosomal protein S16 [Anopheles sinensis]|uniref:30S ribosomal protein S16 n=1 Tax=Anopheles sinensis TaxID=74873 RepID=A0A084WT66_ANOSI|nr:30S ribosomal protein S16 [Anopheles sinensis]